MKYLMNINIGPVQSFIEAARRTRDLWYGSWLISELSKYAAKTILEQPSNLLISPAITQVEQLTPDYMAVNRLLAVTENPTLLGQKIREQLEIFLLEQWTQVCSRIGSIRSSQAELSVESLKAWIDLDANPEGQIRDLVECIWVAVPFDPNRYKECRDEAERMLAARKNTRNFEPVQWGRRKPKSSLDGIRESVIPESRYVADHERQNTELRAKKVQILYRAYHAGPAEQLSAVDLLKRLGGNEEQFARIPSTSHIAARPFLNALERDVTSIKPLVDRLLATLTAKKNSYGLTLDSIQNAAHASQVLGNYDGGFLYENRLRIEAEEQDFNPDWVDNLVAELRSFYRSLKHAAGERLEPSPYYALLLADGDNMGKAIDAQTTIEKHQALARTLDDFAREAGKIVQEHRGSLVYAGGDDVMAFLPLDTVFVCANTLADKFREQLNPFANADGIKPTLSCGITIAHHLEPLSDVLRMTRSAEKEAKKIDGKDAVAITLSKRSGIDRTIKGRWQDGLTARLQEFIKLYQERAIPHGYAYELANLHQRLTVPAHWQKLSPSQLDLTAAEAQEQNAKGINFSLAEAMKAEAKRILERKRTQTGTPFSKNAKVTPLQDAIQTISLQELAYELVIAETLASAQYSNLNGGVK